MQQKSIVFVNETLFTPEVSQFFEDNQDDIEVRPYENAYENIKQILDENKDKNTWMDKDRSSAIMMRLVS